MTSKQPEYRIMRYRSFEFQLYVFPPPPSLTHTTQPRGYVTVPRVPPQVFPGNSDPDTVFTNMLDCPVIARCVRINPLDWKDHIALRFDLLGCPALTGNHRQYIFSRAYP